MHKTTLMFKHEFLLTIKRAGLSSVLPAPMVNRKTSRPPLVVPNDSSVASLLSAIDWIATR